MMRQVRSRRFVDVTVFGQRRPAFIYANLPPSGNDVNVQIATETFGEVEGRTLPSLEVQTSPSLEHLYNSHEQ